MSNRGAVEQRDGADKVRAGTENRGPCSSSRVLGGRTDHRRDLEGLTDPDRAGGMGQGTIGLKRPGYGLRRHGLPATARRLRKIARTAHNATATETGLLWLATAVRCAAQRCDAADGASRRPRW
jgi:hypothetical protein